MVTQRYSGLFFQCFVIMVVIGINTGDHTHCCRPTLFHGVMLLCRIILCASDIDFVWSLRSLADGHVLIILSHTERKTESACECLGFVIFYIFKKDVQRIRCHRAKLLLLQEVTSLQTLYLYSYILWVVYNGVMFERILKDIFKCLSWFCIV